MHPDPGFALYVHWPFCAAKCPYCDFNSHVRERIDQAAWRAGLLRSLDHYAARTPGRRLTSIFFGGGTPSLMAPETVGAVIASAKRHWTPADDLEITLEANPGSVDAERFAGYADAGVNRVSLGVQSLVDSELKALGRIHSVGEAEKAIAVAQAHFARFSFDLIYARPGQTVESWKPELERALAYGTGHISLYQLTIEPGTQYQTLFDRGALVLPPEPTQAALYEYTADALEAAGLPGYEVSNHARPGEESRHNLTYWRYGDYVGIGPGAHGRLTIEGRKWATRAHRAPESWLARVESDGHGAHPEEEVPRGAQLTEMVMMGLRLSEGISRARLLAMSGKDAADLFGTRLYDLVEGGLIELGRDVIRATPEGRQRLNAVLGYLLADVTLEEA